MPRQKLTKRADGTYRCRYHGKEFYGKTQTEALKARDAYIELERTGLNPELKDVTFLEYSKKWLSVYRSECCQSLQKQYIGFVEYAATKLRPLMREITATDMQSLCNSLAPYSSSYVTKFMATMRSIFASAVADGVILRNPTEALRHPKTKKCEGHRVLEPWERELVVSTYAGHDFGLVAMVMLFAGLRRGEALYLDVDRDVDFKSMTLTVRGAVSFTDGNQAVTTQGKTEAALRTLPLASQLAEALKDHHGLLCAKKDGGLMSQSAFMRKYDSYISYLERELNGCPKRWYGKTKEHKKLLAEGKELPPWRNVTIRCHDFRVDYCTRCYDARIPVKTLQTWMGHSTADMIMNTYSKLTDEQERADALKLAAYEEQNKELTVPSKSQGKGSSRGERA